MPAKSKLLCTVQPVLEGHQLESLNFLPTVYCKRDLHSADTLSGRGHQYKAILKDKNLHQADTSTAFYSVIRAVSDLDSLKIVQRAEVIFRLSRIF